MAAGRMNCLLTLERATPTPDEFGGAPQVWAHLADAWAERRDVADGERLAMDQPAATLVARFKLRATAVTRTLNAKDRIRFGETYDEPPAPAVWRILGVKQAKDGRERFLEVIAARDMD